MIWSVSWKNVWRNKTRSGVVITAVSLGVLAGVFSMAFMKGMAKQRVDSAIKTETSHIQIHTPEYVNVNDLENYFTNSEELRLNILSKPSAIAVSRRIIVNSIISSAEKGSGIRLFGIEPEQESQVTNIKDKLIEGNYLEPLKRSRPIVIGSALAEKLDVKSGSKLVVGLVDINSQPIYFQFRVVGIFKTLSTPFDEATAFVNYSDLISMTKLPEGSAHEIALLLNDKEASTELALELKKENAELSVMEWIEILPELKYMTETMDFYMYIFIFIILLALGFGIVNTMLMVVLERVKELGMLMSIGMNKRRVFSMIMLETVFLSLTGGVIGLVLGAGISAFFTTHGLDFSGLYKEGLEALGYNTIVYTDISPEMIFTIAIMVILTGVLASVYPAIKALKLNPAEALRSDN
ncbi:MAG: FtsX-like permease family protein [Bacteroidales bacterium]|nr:FtsX-like permease family protein [Bacteroidales bacterium]MCF8389657.1 FtsX-like permease family protein [Bacteroidales bacterium]